MGRVDNEWSKLASTDYVRVTRMNKGNKERWALLSTLMDYANFQVITTTAVSTAITIKNGTVLFTNASGGGTATLAAPTATDDDGKVLRIYSTSAQGHTVTIANGLAGAGSGADVGTFGGAVADGVTLVAYNGAWYQLANTNVVFG